MTIGEVVRRAGIPASTLRFYEKEKLIIRPPRVSGRREYDERVFLNLKLIQMALESGFTIREARVLIHGFSNITRPPERWRALAVQKLAEVRQRLEQLHRAEDLLERTAACKCNSLADCARILLPLSVRPLNRAGKKTTGTVE